jgi:hypothetical protein
MKSFSEVKYCLDGCCDSADPSLVITTEPIRKGLKELIKRGIGTSYITIYEEAHEKKKMEIEVSVYYKSQFGPGNFDQALWICH